MKVCSVLCAVIAVLVLLAGPAGAAAITPQALAQATPGYNNKIPEKIMTPDKVETRIGTLEFFDGMPSKNTVEKVYENLDLMRGVGTFLNGVPAASVEALRAGMVAFGAKTYSQVVIMDQLMDSRPLVLDMNFFSAAKTAENVFFNHPAGSFG